MTLQTDIQTTEKKIGVFLSAHHIVLYVLLLGAALTGIYLVESKIASLQEARAQAAGAGRVADLGRARAANAAP